MPVVPRFLGLFSSGLRVTFSIDSPRMWSRFVTNALPPQGLSVCHRRARGACPRARARHARRTRRNETDEVLAGSREC